MTKPASSSGKVWLVGAGPGDPDLITCRGVEVLRNAEVVLHDALSHPDLLEHCPHAEIHDVGKRYGQHSPDQDLVTARLLHFARQGKRVVRLKGGDPMLFARGAEEALALAEAGVPFEVVPGISSAIAASEFAGISLTHRDASSSVTFITGSDRAGKEWSPEAWKKLATATGTICVLMGMRRIEAITRAIIEGGRDPATPAAVVMWGARPEQRTAVATLADIAALARAQGLSSPSIIIIGEVVELRRELNWYETKPLFGLRVLVARPQEQAAQTVRALRERGARAVVRPAIEITAPTDGAPLSRAIRELAGYDWVVFTSQNGVRALLDGLRAQGRDARAFGCAKIAAIGPKTAAALGPYGLSADLVAEEFVAESLVEKLSGQGPLGRVLLARAESARDVLPDGLRAAGAEVQVVAAYSTHAVSGLRRAELIAALEHEVDVVLFTSSSMVDSVVDALGDAAASLAKRRVVCIGPITAETARQHGLRVDLIAPVYTLQGALDALERDLTPGA